jgi:hypothetical protein
VSVAVVVTVAVAVAVARQGNHRDTFVDFIALLMLLLLLLPHLCALEKFKKFEENPVSLAVSKFVPLFLSSLLVSGSQLGIVEHLDPV